jgi:hypothetical protein
MIADERRLAMKDAQDSLLACVPQTRADARTDELSDVADALSAALLCINRELNLRHIETLRKG